MIACLPMYEREETQGAHDRFWALIRRALPGAPDALTRGGDLWSFWRSADLLLGQTCGLPYRADLHRRVFLVGTPDYGLPGCPAGHYRSVLVCRADMAPCHDVTDLLQQRIAVNDAMSQSGWAVLTDIAKARGLAIAPDARETLTGGHGQGRAEHGKLGPVLFTGSHRASARAVQQGQADIAALDAVTWALIKRHDRFATGLRVLHQSDPTPGLPLITARHDLVPQLRKAVGAAISALSPQDRSALMIEALVDIPRHAYLSQPLPPNPADPA